MLGHICISCDDGPVDQPSCRRVAEGVHVLDKAGQLGQVLSNPRLCDESAGSTAYFNESAIREILDGFADRRAADREALNQLFLRWQLASNRELAAGNAGGDLRFEYCIQRGRVGKLIHLDMMTSCRHDVYTEEWMSDKS